MEFRNNVDQSDGKNPQKLHVTEYTYGPVVSLLDKL